MKILYLCTFYHRAFIFRDSMNHLIKLGNSVNVFNAVQKNTKIEDKYISIMDDLVIHKECFNKWDRLIFHLKQFKIYKALTKSYNLKDYDVIHSHTLFNGGYAAYLANRKYGIPYIVSVRNTDINIFLKIPLFVKIANEIVNNASGIQFLSVPYKEQFINKFVEEKSKIIVSEKSSVINNGLEKYWMDNIWSAKSGVYSPQNTIRVLCVGKVDNNKNIITTIKSLDILILKGYDIEFTIVGNIVDEEVRRKLKEVSYVKLINYLKKEELIEVYRENQIFVMPSHTETFGRVYAEAMTQGLPVIYTEGQGFDGIFEDGDIGFKVPSNNPEYISECILKVLNDYTNISSRCIEKCSKFDWNIIASELNEFYKSSIVRGRGKNESRINDIS